MLTNKDKQTIACLHPDSCTGCAACAAACPSRCITMRPDREGFLHPKVDKTRCTKCGGCTSICPVISNKSTSIKVDIPQEPAAYAAWHIDPEIRHQSSSGGVFTALAESIFSQGGVVVGAVFDDFFVVRHILIESIDHLSKLRGSKYVQSEVSSSLYHQIRILLEQGRKVLFSGTPCQVAGLRSFLLMSRSSIESGQLLLVELICMRVPSPRVFELYLQELCRKYGAPLTEFRFRDKGTSGVKKSMVVASFGNGRIYRCLITEDAFLQGFFGGLYCRPSCEKCSFRSLRSGADITIGDFWGVENVFPRLDDGMGVSAVLANTVFGARCVDQLSPHIVAIPTTFSDVKAGNPALSYSFPAHPKRIRFFKCFLDEPVVVLIERLLRRSFLFRIRLVLSHLRRAISRRG